VSGSGERVHHRPGERVGGGGSVGASDEGEGGRHAGFGRRDSDERPVGQRAHRRGKHRDADPPGDQAGEGRRIGDLEHDADRTLLRVARQQELEGVAQGVARRGSDQSPAAQHGDRDRRPAREGVVGPDRDHQRLLDHGVVEQTRRGLAGDADVGRPYTGSRAVEQRLAQLALELADLSAHPRLRHPQPFRGAGEPALVGAPTGTLHTDLAAAVRGGVTPGPAPTGFQTGVVHRPDAVVEAADADDVGAAVRVAARHGVAVRVQATGHGQGAPATSGLVVSTAAMRGVSVDPRTRIARVGAGTPTADVLDAAGRHGLAPVSGSSPGVGLVGYTLAGGFGLLGREFGYAVDHVRALDVVTADGERRRVTADPADADLFRALRGCRDPMAIVTAMEIGLVPVATVLGGGLWFPADEAAGSAAVVPVLRVLRDVLADAPDTLTVTAGTVGTVGLPYLDAVPEALRGRHVLHVRLVSTLATPSARAAAEDALTRLRAAGTTLAEDVREMPWSDSGEIVGEPPWAHAYDGTDVLVTDLSAEDLGTLVERAGPGTGVVLDVRPLGGAFARRPHVPDAVSFRHADFVVRVISVTDGTGADRDTVRAAHDHVLSALYELDDRVLGRAAAFLYGRARAEAVPEELWTRRRWSSCAVCAPSTTRAGCSPAVTSAAGDVGRR